LIGGVFHQGRLRSFAINFQDLGAHGVPFILRQAK
jgi:hypothetical protein